MSISPGGYCNNQTFVLFERSCNLIDIRDGFSIDILSFWRHVGDILGRKINQNRTWIATWIEEALESAWGSVFSNVLSEMQGFGEVLEGSEASWEGFWRVLKASWGSFSIYFGIFFSYSFCNGFLYAFEMIFEGF